jgi:hypothetical protein
MPLPSCGIEGSFIVWFEVNKEKLGISFFSSVWMTLAISSFFSINSSFFSTGFCVFIKNDGGLVPAGAPKLILLVSIGGISEFNGLERVNFG